MVSAVVLAAGGATRFGSPKQLVLLPYVLATLRSSGIDEIVVVEGAYPITESPSLSLEGVRVVSCTQWAVGPGASLRCGLKGLAPEVDQALIVLADGPYLDPRAIERVLAHRGEGAIIAASYDGTRSHPVLLERRAWESIPDDGARGLEVTLVDCADLTAPGDIDTPDLAAGL